MDLHPLLGSVSNNVITGLAGGLGPGDPPNPMAKEMRQLYKKNVSFDNRTAIDVARTAAQKGGISPSLLFSSAFTEGYNKAIAHPDDVSEAYINAQNKGFDTKNYPVDGFFNYGLDTFGDRYGQLKKYLPAGFDQRFKTYPAFNEKGQKVTTAGFKSNEDALIAKSAMLRNEADTVSNYAKSKGVTLDDNAKNYFTLASYNGGFGNAKIMLDEYSKSADKQKFIKEGQTSRKGVHKNIYGRIQNMALAQQLLDEKP